jgi:hypothetical protein
MNASEPLKTCRKRRNGIKTGEKSLTREEHGWNLFQAVWSPALRWHESVMQRLSGTWEPSVPILTERFKQKPCKNHSREAAQRGGITRSSEEVPEKRMERRGRNYGGGFNESTGNGRNR